MINFHFALPFIIQFCASQTKTLGCIFLIHPHTSCYGSQLSQAEHETPLPQSDLIDFLEDIISYILQLLPLISKTQSTCNVVIVQSLSRVQLCDPVDCSTSGFPVLHHLPELPKLVSIKSVMPSNNLILCHPLFLQPSIFPSIRVVSNESALHISWPKHWCFSFIISPSNEYSGLISFRMDWFDLLVVQGTLKSLPQYHSSRASVHWHSAFFKVQLSHSYMTTRKSQLWLNGPLLAK